MSIEYKIIEHIATISENFGETKELNIISYGGSKPKMDIRRWSNGSIGKGITLDQNEFINLRDAINQYLCTPAEKIVAESNTKEDLTRVTFNADNLSIQHTLTVNMDETAQGKCLRVLIKIPLKQKLEDSYLVYANQLNMYLNIMAIPMQALINGDELIVCGYYFKELETVKTIEEQVNSFLLDNEEMLNEIGCPKRNSLIGYDAKLIADNNLCLGYKDFVVIANLKGCIHGHHDCKPIDVYIDFVGDDGQIHSYPTAAYYCESCETYFILQNDYNRVVEFAFPFRPLCVAIDQEQAQKHPDWHKKDWDNYWSKNLKDESIYHKYGYNVSTGMTDKQRRSILVNMIENSIVTKMQTISFLGWLYDQKPGRVFAKRLWESDREFIRNYDENTPRERIEAKRIFHKKVYK